MSGNKKSKKKLIIILIVIAVIAIIIAIIALSKKKTSGVKTSYVDTTATMQDLSTYYSYDGNITSGRTQNVYATAVGTVEAIPVSTGEMVKQGDLIAYIDYDSSSNLSSAQLSYSSAKKNYDRMKELYEIDAISLSELESAKNSLDNAGISLSNAAGKADNESIYAKFDGMVVSIPATEGDEVKSGDTIMTVISYDNLQVEVSIDEYDIAEIKDGQEATITVNSTGNVYKGYVKEISRQASVSNGVSYFSAIVAIENDESLSVGLSVEVNISISNTGSVLAVPVSCVQYDEERTPYVLDEKNNKISVETGATNGIYIEIKSGLIEGQTVKQLVITGSGSEESSGGASFMMGPGMGGAPGGGQRPSGGPSGSGSGNRPSGGSGSGMPGGGF